MTTRDIASQITEAAKAADAIFEKYLSDPNEDVRKLAEMLKPYVSAKLQLKGDEINDNITIMVSYITEYTRFIVDMRKDIVKLIKDLKESAQQCADSILKDPDMGYEEFAEHFTKYLCFKFMLDPAELTTDNFYEICQLSAEKSSHLPKGMLDAAELASKCGGATTAMNKKVLFLLNVNETFGITITAEESVQIDTFTQLKELLYKKINEKKNR